MRIVSLASLVATLIAALGLGASATAQTIGRDPFVFVYDADENGRSGSGLAWWLLKSTIRPTGTTIAGLTLEQLNAKLEDPMMKWCFVSAFTPASFVSPSRRVQSEIDGSLPRRGASIFRTSGAFTGDVTQDAIVGSYETCDGAIGAFLLITTRAEPAIVYLDAFPEWQGLMWMSNEDDGIAISSCFECGHRQKLYYDKARRRFYWVNEGD